MIYSIYVLLKLRQSEIVNVKLDMYYLHTKKKIIISYISTHKKYFRRLYPRTFIFIFMIYINLNSFCSL